MDFSCLPAVVGVSLAVSYARLGVKVMSLPRTMPGQRGNNAVPAPSFKYFIVHRSEDAGTSSIMQLWQGICSWINIFVSWQLNMKVLWAKSPFIFPVWPDCSARHSGYSFKRMSTRRFVITVKIRVISWLKVLTSPIAIKTLLIHYAKWTMTLVGAFSVIVKSSRTFV